jgi:hypothetical protein
MRHGVLLFFLALLLARGAWAANIVIVNVDGPGEGFNDPTPAAPVGGNPGTTIGQQRLNLFDHAADIWGALLPSDVTIRVEARFNPQTCSSSSAVLGSAGPIEVFRDFVGAEFSDTWYHVALANKQAGMDLAGTNDISATFNSSIDNNDDCLAGRNWYYGFDGNEGGDVELLPVLLHELGHGLGFSTLVGSNGSEFLSSPDLFETFLYDSSLGLHWDEMTDSQRAASTLNTGNLLWDGFATTFLAPTFLGPAPVLDVNSPPTLPSSFEIVLAAFGPGPTEVGITADVILVSDGVDVDTDACSPIQNGVELAGNIALIDRGACTFVSKAQQAEAAGAVAVIIANNVAGSFGLGGTDPGLTIPTVGISLDDGNLIKAALGGGVNVTLGLDVDVLAGTGDGGRVRMYAPDPYQGGSSVSHWDVSANPSLLMEPAITTGLSDDVDLTLAHFEDIGWLDERLTATPSIPSARASLAQNTPNPFNPRTTISFSLDRDEAVRLQVFDLAGRLVRNLVDRPLTAGVHQVAWDGLDEGGQTVASGVYVYRLKTPSFTQSRRMILLK